ncbi:TetR/AcrR family transcriptional regulator [Marinomonas agarivorans]|nr:TetR/AcrR family transcriptional regulator [Marinomonas agarivorans]
MINTKKLGRPKKFNREDALQAALNLFWSKGYDGASMKELTTAMGINGPSLYATFGDKHALYLQAIEAYTSDHACEPLVAFENESNIHLAIQAFFHAAIDYATDNDSGNKGCFLTSCVATSSGEVEGVQPMLKNTIEELDQRLAARFELEKSKGTLAPDFPSLERARLMFDLRQGYAFRARAGLKGHTMMEDLEKRAKMVLQQ